MASYIVRSIPNTLTCCNLLSGCGATLTAINSGDFKLALLYIIIGAVFDFFDGFAARMLHVSSPTGKRSAWLLPPSFGPISTHAIFP